MEHTKEYQKIDKILTRIEEGKYATQSISWCISRVDWAWQWRKITTDEVDELSRRCVDVLERG